jgi:hypothetical protein
MGWVIVEFPETREVFVDDRGQGNNRDEQGRYLTLIVQDGLHTLRLGGLANVQPAYQDVEVSNTSALAPLHVIFRQV